MTFLNVIFQDNEFDLVRKKKNSFLTAFLSEL